jgi:hypothetical protein
VVYACDRKWWELYADRVHRLCPGEPWTINPTAARVYGLNVVSSLPGGGIATRPNTIREGGNSGFQALGLALLFGAARVILLGYDMGADARRRLHWHADHGDGLANPHKGKFAEWCRNFDKLAAQTSVPIVNASRASALGCFPRVDLDEALGG